ncbi:unnamed protein product [Microthlaspi erraticum]|uniref:Uncharacterized protein n=1 Tax=Microthlaspi erraticum TaxID=1685480 RepID=A0A6D2I266_9BRAS|nr:unnamed protein product [Microthlaspi erraticum]
MDFIKTSSLRALIELTFQRNWNGFIWMSRKGVIAKRVKAAPDGYIENQRPNAQSGWPRNECSALGQNRSVRLKSRPKFQTVGRSRNTTRETLSRGRPSLNVSRHAAHDHAARAGKQASRPRNLRVPRPMHPSEPGRTSHVRPRNHRPNLIRRPSRPTMKPSGHDRSDSAQDPTVRPIVPTDRPNAAVDPKPFLKPNPHNSSPKPAPT